MTDEECNCDQTLALKEKLEIQRKLLVDMWTCIECDMVKENFFTLRERVRNISSQLYA